MTRPLLLLTRPEPQSRELAGLLEAIGYDCLVAPLLRIEPILPAPDLDLEGVQALLFTSVNGVQFFVAQDKRRDLPALAVGPATAEALRAAGFEDVRQAGGDAAALADLAQQTLQPDGGVVLHLAGEAVAGDLVGELEGRGYRCHRLALYRAVAAETLPDQARQALSGGRLSGVLLFSPRTAKAFARLVQADGLGAATAPLTAWCLSEAVAKEAGALPWRRVRVAPAPEQDRLLALLREDLPLSDKEPKEPTEAPAMAKDDAKEAEAPASDGAGFESAPPREPASGGKGWLLVVLLLVVVGGGVLALWLSPAAQDWLGRWTGGLVASGPTAPPAAAPPPVSGPDPQLTELSRRLADLERRPPPAPAAPSASAEKIADLEQRLEELKADRQAATELEARLREIEANLSRPVEVVTAASPDLGPLARRIEDLATRLATSESGQQRVAQLESRLAALEQRLASFEAGLSGTQTSLKTLAESVGSSGAEARKLAVVVALARLAQAVERGGPYAAELASLRQLAGESLDGAALAKLTPHAAKGLPTGSAFARRFETLIPRILAAEREAGEAAWWERTLGRVMSLVSVRRVGEVEGEGAEATVARTENRLAAGDLAAAASELAKLGPAGAAAVADFRAELDARLAAEAALAGLERAALRALAQEAGAK